MLLAPVVFFRRAASRLALGRRRQSEKPQLLAEAQATAAERAELSVEEWGGAFL